MAKEKEEIAKKKEDLARESGKKEIERQQHYYYALACLSGAAAGTSCTRSLADEGGRAARDAVHHGKGVRWHARALSRSHDAHLTTEPQGRDEGGGAGDDL